MAVAWRADGYYAAAVTILIMSVTACWRYRWRWVRRRQPGVSPDTELVKSQMRDGDPRRPFIIKEPAKPFLIRKLNLVYIYGESPNGPILDNDAFPNLTPELGALKMRG